jgi:hypothetical protein
LNPQDHTNSFGDDPPICYFQIAVAEGREKGREHLDKCSSSKYDKMFKKRK